jgi:hypothetical protein
MKWTCFCNVRRLRTKSMRTLRTCSWICRRSVRENDTLRNKQPAVDQGLRLHLQKILLIKLSFARQMPTTRRHALDLMMECRP